MLNLPVVVPQPATTTGPGGTTTLQQAYTASSNGIVVLDSTRNGLIVRDAAVTIGASVPLFQVQTPAGAETVLSVRRALVAALTDKLTITTSTSGAQTASTEQVSVDVDTSATKQFATGALAIQRAGLFRAPTYSFVGASTLAQAATVAITAAPIAGTNATLTETMSLWTQNGLVRHDMSDASATSQLIALIVAHKSSIAGAAGIGAGMDFQVHNAANNIKTAGRIVGLLRTVTDGAEQANLLFQTNIGGTVSNAFWTTGAALYSSGTLGIGTVTTAGVTTTQYSITTASSMWTYNNNLTTLGGHAFTGAVNISGARQFFTITPSANTGSTLSTEINNFSYAAYTHQWATGALVTQREVLWSAPTYAFVGASTITVAATMAISGAPIAGTNATITKSLAFWVQSGFAQFDGRVIINAPDSAIADADLPVSSVSGYLNEAGNTLVFKAKYAAGTVKTGTVALT